ncbi:hypothetical protein D929_02751 [Enterococcus faecalis 02-MB-P-10]|uniref:hypothetical protein n=1 Tax=Enterococcus faecalis TaxID=1351 RepID=UPI0003547F81|nr:hypothetical protein [Enterococcus faecalis]EPH68653.1 hypothetical protein D929_02751 [Enterococcus faecalis 02-MB-P-10]
MTDKEWFRQRKIEKIEKYLCLLLGLVMLYSLCFNWVLLLRIFGILILVAIIVSIQETIQIIKEHHQRKIQR